MFATTNRIGRPSSTRMDLAVDFNNCLYRSLASASVEVARTGVTGLLRYDGRRFHIDHIPQGEPVAVGDPIMSSGLGRTVPRGLTIGTVKSVRAVPSELFQQVEVETEVRFSAIRRVFVITDDGPWYSSENDFAPELQADEVPDGGSTP